MTIGKVIKQRRIPLGLTMKQVAEYVGVSEATVSRWESGDIANMGRNRIIKLSTILRISPLEIVGKNEFSVSPNKGISLSSHEQSLIQAYRSHPEMQSAVDKLLSIEENIEKEKTGTA